MICILIFTLISQVTLAQGRISLLPPPENSPLIKKTIPKEDTSRSNLESQKKASVKPYRKRLAPTQTGNLPAEYKNRIFKLESQSSPILVPTSSIGLRYTKIKPGDVLDGRILESAVAFSDSKAPIRAIISSGPLKNSIFLGEASLEKNSKRITITFNRFRKAKDEYVYHLTAHAMDLQGVLGLKGEIHSGESLYFTAEFLAAGAAGFADTTIERSQNANGNYVEAPTFSNATKKALTNALAQTANRFGEKLKSVPEYATLEGPIDIKILVTDELKTK